MATKAISVAEVHRGRIPLLVLLGMTMLAAVALGWSLQLPTSNEEVASTTIPLTSPEIIRARNWEGQAAQGSLLSPEAFRTYAPPKAQSVFSPEAVRSYAAPQAQSVLSPEAFRTYAAPQAQSVLSPEAFRTYAPPKAQTVFSPEAVRSYVPTQESPEEIFSPERARV